MVRSPIHLFLGSLPEAAADTTRYTVTGTKLIITACTTAAVIHAGTIAVTDAPIGVKRF